MFEVVRRAGVDAYFYVPPIDSDVYAEPDGGGVHRTSSARCSPTTTRGQTNDRVHFDPQGLQDRVPPTEYKDIIHMLDGEPEADVLAQDLCALLVGRGKKPECEGS